MTKTMRPVLAIGVGLLLWTAVVNAAELKITIYSDPPGATLYEVGDDGGLKPFGLAPITLKYGLPRKWTACFALKELRVRWISGAEAGSKIQACPQNTAKQEVFFMRPTGVDGALMDAQYALALATNRAATEASALSQWQAMAELFAPRPQPTTTRCTTRVIARTIYTDCTQR